MTTRKRPVVSGQRVFVVYTVMLLATIAAFLVVRGYGQHLQAPPATVLATARQAAADSHVLPHILFALAVVMAATWLVGRLFAVIHQPPVMGEVLAGILLGPSVLGYFAPGAVAFLLPPEVAPYLNLIAQIGIILYMFLVGVKLDTHLLRGSAHVSIAVSHASIIAPFFLGSTLALWLYPRLSTSDVPFTAFALFLGVSMSVTAFPVLARILTDRGLHRTKMGAIALSCAAVDDVSAWCLLAFTISVVQSQPSQAVWTAALTLAFIVTVLFAVRPLVLRLINNYEERSELTHDTLTAVLIGIMLAALATELIGIHALFGAFLLGAIVPHDSALARHITGKIEQLVVVMWLPAFFAFTGMRTQIGLIHGIDHWLMLGVILLVASVGKFGGGMVAARLSGIGWRHSAALGILMNTRGLMELIVLNIGLDLGVISPTLFAMMVLMALVTTFMTTPMLHFLTRHESVEAADATARR